MLTVGTLEMILINGRINMAFGTEELQGRTEKKKKNQMRLISECNKMGLIDHIA